MEKPKRVIVTFAKGLWYPKGLARLIKSIEQFNPEIPVIGFTEESQISCPPHTSDPYAFKLYAIDKVIEQGYNQILWLDVSIFAVKDITPVFDHIDKIGFMFQYNGNIVGHWTNDFTLDYFGITRDEAMQMEMQSNGGFFGLDVRKDVSKEFLNHWKASQMSGCFQGAWNNDKRTESTDSRCRGHRHDMSSGSIIAHQLGMSKYSVKENPFMAYVGQGYGPAPDSAVFHAQGMI